MDWLSSLPCRSCGKTGLQTILDLGLTPLANSLLTAGQLQQSDPVFPLHLVFCPHCALVQITETVPPEQLFRDYVYFSSFSDTALRNAAGRSQPPTDQGARSKSRRARLPATDMPGTQALCSGSSGSAATR